MKKITLLDGATGTRLWALAEAAGLEKYTSWRYNLEHPELVAQVAREYVDAGSEIICTNTFTCNRFEMSHYANAPAPAELAAAAVRIGRSVAEGTGVKVALDLGPLPLMLEPFGNLSRETAVECYREILAGGMQEKPDLIYFETFTSLELLTEAVKATAEYDVPVFCSMSFQPGGKTLMGNAPAEIAQRLEDMGVTAVGLNCSFGPENSIDVIREFRAHTDLPLILKPNVEEGVSPEQFADRMAPGLEIVSYVGGCCGSNAACIRALKKRL